MESPAKTQLSGRRSRAGLTRRSSGNLGPARIACQTPLVGIGFIQELGCRLLLLDFSDLRDQAVAWLVQQAKP